MSADNKSIELYDLKQEIVQNSYKHKIIEKNVNTITVNLKKNDIIEKEIDRLEDSTKVYDRIGRIFILTDKQTTVNKIKENSKKLVTDLETQKDLKKKMEETLTSQTRQYNEIAKSKIL